MKIVFSDEAHYLLDGCVNKQNGRFWIEDQPKALQELPMHPEKNAAKKFGAVYGLVASLDRTS